MGAHCRYLIRLVGDFDVAEEAAQAAFTEAVNQWESDGIPDRPRAWIIRTAGYKAIDRLRRRTKLTEKLEWYAASGLIPSTEEPTYDNTCRVLGKRGKKKPLTFSPNPTPS
ncbi:MAG: sigma factor [Nostoc sp. CmiVER01]|uniref:sigma factor n=1 Tax=Nostoc sp. CmiVER01 TaxID=3075384 RepID=UPI002AD47224|nr:sigma factor [Nostoc sp. CmiVER01]MDZ8124234.1 sigma factor [Nostoc sp. CmiVER01]